MLFKTKLFKEAPPEPSNVFPLTINSLLLRSFFKESSGGTACL
jgi:hypothetical protein